MWVFPFAFASATASYGSSSKAIVAPRGHLLGLEVYCLCMGLPMSEECMPAHPSGSLDTRHTTIVLICSVV